MELTKNQLIEMDRDTESFNRLRTCSDFDRYLIHRGAINSRGEIRISTYEQVMDEIEQHAKWLGKIQYAKRMQLKDLDILNG